MMRVVVMVVTTMVMLMVIMGGLQLDDGLVFVRSSGLDEAACLIGQRKLRQAKSLSDSLHYNTIG